MIRHRWSPDCLVLAGVIGTIVAFLLLVAMADRAAEETPTPMTPATAGPAVEYQP